MTKLLLVILLSSGAQALTIDDSLVQMPQSYQVFQRSSLSAGKFRLKLAIGLSGVNRIQVSVYNSQNQALLATSVSATPARGSVYENSFELPAGGWYRLQVLQIADSTAQSIQSSVGIFGIGDVFVTAGQSNSTSAGEALIQSAAMVSAYVPEFLADGHLNGFGSWQANRDPQPPETLPTLQQALEWGISPENFGSVWPTMGDQLSFYQNIPIATAETGVGGTSISQWQKDYVPAPSTGMWHGPYVRLMETTKRLLQTTGVRMILWDQGESDHNESSSWPLELYSGKFKRMQAALAADVGRKIPWMVAKASFIPMNPHLDGSGCDSQLAPQPTHSIVLSQEKLIKDKDAYEGPNTDLYVGPGFRYPGKRGACIHFARAAQIAIGQDWAQAIVNTPFGKFPDGTSSIDDVTQPPAPGVLPSPAGRTPVVLNAGRGCDDRLCLWFIANNIESDVRIDFRMMDTTAGIDWTYEQSRMNVSVLPDGNYALTLRLSEIEAQQALQRDGINAWVVNPTSRTWTDRVHISP